MTATNQNLTAAQRHHSRTPHQIEATIGAISAFALGRVASGLPGLPGHPKQPGQIALSAVAAALGLKHYDFAHPKLVAYLKKVAETHGVETPQQATLAKALTAIEAAYANKAVPYRGKKLHLSAIRLATGVAQPVLKAPDAQALLKTLADRNGTVRPDVDYDAESSALAAYGARLRAAGLRLPAKPGGEGPGIAQIARAIGLSPARFGRPHLAEGLERLVQELGIEPNVTIAADTARFAAFVDDMIAARTSVPCGRKGIAYQAIGQLAGITPHRIACNRSMQTELQRWIFKVGVDETR